LRVRQAALLDSIRLGPIGPLMGVGRSGLVNENVCATVGERRLLHALISCVVPKLALFPLAFLNVSVYNGAEGFEVGKSGE